MIDKCYAYISDEDFLASPITDKIDIEFNQNMEKCWNEVFNMLPTYDKALVKRNMHDDKSSIAKNFIKNIANCMLDMRSDEDYKKERIYENYKITTDKQNECINNLTHEEIEALKSGNVKATTKISICYKEKMTTDDLINNLVLDEISDNEDSKLNYYTKDLDKEKAINCLEEKVNKLSPEELKKFKLNPYAGDIVNSCFHNK